MAAVTTCRLSWAVDSSAFHIQLEFGRAADASVLTSSALAGCHLYVLRGAPYFGASVGGALECHMTSNLISVVRGSVLCWSWWMGIVLRPVGWYC
jgi:hypothetical protein